MVSTKVTIEAFVFMIYNYDINKLTVNFSPQLLIRFSTSLPSVYLQSLPIICLVVCVLVVLVLEHNCTPPLLSLHSSHPTLCAGRGWLHRLCLTTHSIITFFSSILSRSCYSYNATVHLLLCTLYLTYFNLSCWLLSSCDLCASANACNGHLLPNL